MACMLMSYEFRVVCAAQAEADCFNRTCMRFVPNGEHDGERQPGVPDAVNNRLPRVANGRTRKRQLRGRDK